MNRTQIQLTEDQIRALKKLAAEKGVSVAELVRQGVDLVLQASSGVSRTERLRRAIAASGRFRSERGDLSIRHDDYFAEAIDS